MNNQKQWAMILILMLSLAGCATTAPKSITTDRKQDSFGKLLWSDEFNGSTGSLPDTSKWSANIGGKGWGNKQLEYDTDNQNIYQDGHGNLVLEARKDNPDMLQCWYGPCQYTSARISTSNHFSFTYGRLEARIKIPYGQGIWPAFWMLGNNIGSVGWPACGEIDIMENFGYEPSKIHATVHGTNYSGTNGISGFYVLPSDKISDGYHIYSVQWDSSQIAFFMDGINYFTVTKSVVESQGQWAFDHPFNIIFNVAVGGGTLKKPSTSTVFPQKMYIDYVRLYSL